MKKRALGIMLFSLVLVLLLSTAAYADAVYTAKGTVYASQLAKGGNYVLQGDTTLVMDSDQSLSSIRGNYDLTIQDSGGHKLTITMPMDPNIITVNGDGHGISVKSLTCDADLNIKARKDALNIDGDIVYTAPTLGVTCGGDAVYSRNGDVYLIDVTSVMITAEGNSLSAPRGYVQFRGDYLNAETTGSNYYCIVGQRVNLEGGTIIASSTANCIVANDYQGIQLAGKITASGGNDFGSVIDARNGGGITIAEGSDLTVRGDGNGLYSTKGVEMEGSGKLDIEAEAGAGIYAGNGDIKLLGETGIFSGAQAIVAKSSDAKKGIVSVVNTQLAVRNADPNYSAIQGKQVNIRVNEGTIYSSCQYAVRAAGNITLDGYLKISTDSEKTPSAVLKTTDGGNVSLEGVSSVNLVGNDKSIDCDGTFYQDVPLIAEGGVAAKTGVKADGNIYITASKGNGIRADNGDIKLGEYAEISAKDTAIVAEKGNVTFSSLEAVSSERLGIYALGTVTMLGEANSSGTLAIEAEREGIMAGGNVALLGKEVSIIGRLRNAIYSANDVTVKARATLEGGMERDIVEFGLELGAGENYMDKYAAVYGRNVTLDGEMNLTGSGGGVRAGNDIVLDGDITALCVLVEGDEFTNFIWHAMRGVDAKGTVTINGRVDATAGNTVSEGIYGNKGIVTDPDRVTVLVPSDGIIISDPYGKIIQRNSNWTHYYSHNVVGPNPLSGSVELDKTVAMPGDTVHALVTTTATSSQMWWEFRLADEEKPYMTSLIPYSYTIKDADATTDKYIRVKLKAPGYSGALYSDWCYIPFSQEIIGSIVFTSGAKVGSKLTTARTGLLKEIEDLDASIVHYQWQRMPNNKVIWEDIPGATTTAYVITAEDVLADLRLIATVDGMTGKVVSPVKEIRKAPAGDTVPMSSLTYADGVITVTRAFDSQEYVATLSAGAPTASEWASAVSPLSTGELNIPVSGSFLNNSVYVHTRLKETATTLAGTKDKYSRIYTGEGAYLKGLALQNSSGSPVSNENSKVGRIVAIKVSPQPESFPTSEWNATTVNWYVNNNPSYPGAVELYKDKDCTQPLERDAYGVIKPTTQHTVYYKAESWTEYVMIGASVTIGYNEIVDAHMYLNVSNENDLYILQSIYFQSIEAFPGDEIVTSFTTRPAKSYLGELSFRASETNPAGQLTVTADTTAQKVTVTVPEDAEPGIYSYDYLIDGEKPANGTYIVITVKEKTATVSFDEGDPNEGMKKMSKLIKAPLLKSGSGMESQTVPLGSQFILPENGFEVPEGYEFDGWDLGEAGDGIDVTQDTRVTAKWKVHVHSMVHASGFSADCTHPGQMEHWYCERCGRYYGDENGLYGGYYDAAMYMIPASGHNTEGVEPVRVNETAASCTEDGGYDMAVCCSVCGEPVSSVHTVIPAFGHTPAEAVIEDTVEAKCTDAGSYCEVVYCSVCGEELSRTKKTESALGHDLSLVPAVPADCGGPGNIAYYACSRCGGWFLDSEGTQPIDDHHDVVIEAESHQWGEPVWTWAEDGSSAEAELTCENDGDHVISVAAEIAVEHTAPTRTEDGQDVFTATVIIGSETFSDTKTIVLPMTGKRTRTLSRKKDSKTVSVEVNLDTDVVKVEGAASVEAPILVASYDENGRFIGVEFVMAGIAEVETDGDAKTVEILWIDEAARPETEVMDVDLTE